MNKNIFEGAATLIGTIIGAGILGIPFVVMKAGFLTSLITLVGIGLILMLTNLAMGEIVLRTKGKHQLTGYSSIYLGSWGKGLMTFSMVFGIYGALLAYLIGEGQVLSQLFGGGEILWSIIFLIAGSLFILGGVEYLKKSEFWLTSIELIIFLGILIALFSSKQFSVSNLTEFSWTKILVPYGVVLFAYLGTSCIPAIKEEMKNNLKNYKKAILLGSIIPIFVYILFAFAVVAVTGAQTTQIATIGVGKILGSFAVVIFNLFAFLAMTTSFISLGFALKEMFIYDFKFNKHLSWLFVISIPIIVFFIGVQNFTKTLETTGAISGGVAGILIGLMYFKVQKLGNRKPEYKMNYPSWLIWIAIIIFFLGAGLELGINEWLPKIYKLL